MIKNLYLSFIAGSNSLDDLKGMIDPILPYFEGIRCVLHSDRHSPESAYLEENKKNGKVIYADWIKRHDHSRNKYLYETNFQYGDWFIQTDVLEHPKPYFLEKIPSIISSNPQICTYYYYGKPFLVRWTEFLFYKGNPHVGLNGTQFIGKIAELNSEFGDETLVRENVRPKKKLDKYHFVKHYAEYMLYPDSNHGLLGLSDRGDPNELFPIRERNRFEFINFLMEKNVKRDADSVIELYSGGPSTWDERMVHFLNTEKVWQDLIRYYVLKDDTVNDNHHWKDMMKF